MRNNINDKLGTMNNDPRVWSWNWDWILMESIIVSLFILVGIVIWWQFFLHRNEFFVWKEKYVSLENSIENGAQIVCTNRSKNRRDLSIHFYYWQNDDTNECHNCVKISSSLAWIMISLKRTFTRLNWKVIPSTNCYRELTV